MSSSSSSLTPCPDPCSCNATPDGAPPSPTPPPPPDYSRRPVRYSNGQIVITEKDLEFSGFGRNWGVTRSYSNLPFPGGGGSGISWSVDQNPRLWVSGDPGIPDEVTVAFSPTMKSQFRKDPASNLFYFPVLNSTASLWHEGGTFWYGDSAGNQVTFTEDLKFKGLVTAGGVSIDGAFSTTYPDRILYIKKTVGGLDTGLFYAYHPDDESPEGRYSVVTLVIKGAEVQRVRYEYYGVDDPNGLEWDLKLAIVEEKRGSSWLEIRRSYYRYYVDVVYDDSDNVIGLPYMMKFKVGAEAYARIIANCLNPLTATDTELSAYADLRLYCDENSRIRAEILDGGSESHAYEYVRNPSPGSGYNAWLDKTIETKTDLSQRIVYSNSFGVGLFVIDKKDDEEWYAAYQFAADGNVVQKAESSAVVSYSEENDSLAVLDANNGLIRSYTFWAPENPENQPVGYLKEEFVQQGTSGTPVLLKSYEYVSVPFNTDSAFWVLSKETLYQSDTGDLAPSVTSYAYERYIGTAQFKRVTKTLPVITTAQNGSSVAATYDKVYDSSGRLTWIRDERGFLTHFTNDSATGSVTQRIDDVNSSVITPPYSWTTPSGGGLHLITDYTLDPLGREVQELGPEHQIDISGTATTIRRAKWTVYKDAEHARWEADGYAVPAGGGSYTYTLVNPVRITQRDKADRIVQEVEAVRASTAGKLDISDSLPQSGWSRWKRRIYDNQSNLVNEIKYFDIPAAGYGVVGTNFYINVRYYDSLKRLIGLKDFDGTIEREVLNPRGWILEKWTGTNDTGATPINPAGSGAPNNMVKVEGRQYDGGFAGGDGNLTQLIAFTDTSTSRTTLFGFDFRNRRVWEDGEVDVYGVFVYDNVNRLIRLDRHNTTGSGNLISRETYEYDNQGRLFNRSFYPVNPSTGSVGIATVELFWFDASGNEIKRRGSQGRGFQKTSFNGMRWKIAEYVACDPTAETYSQVESVGHNIVMKQTDNSFDAAGNLILSVVAERDHDATGDGRLNGPSGAQPKARLSYNAIYPDVVGRAVAEVNFGTNGGSAPSRPSTIPASSDTVLVSMASFDDKGELWQRTDPKGTVTRFAFDEAGRMTSAVENYKSGGTAYDENRTTNFSYTANDQVAQLETLNPTTGTQVTAWNYGTTLAESKIASNKLLRSHQYADASLEQFACNRQGEVIKHIDQRGCIREFEYDLLGRITHDRVTTPGTGVDTTVLRISREYEVRGLLWKVTSWNNATIGSGTAVNQVVRTYNSFGLLEEESQGVQGAVSTFTPKVRYQYNNGTNNTTRPTIIIYPNGRLLSFYYDTAGTIDDLTDRIREIRSPLAVAKYDRRGIDSTAQITYGNDTTPVLMSYIGTPGDAGDQYSGLDRFGRIVDIRWFKASPVVELERIKYGFDRAGNRIWRQEVLGSVAGYDNSFAYDGLYQLKQRKQGTLVSGSIGGTPKAQEDILFDPAGNWVDYETRTNGTLTLDQTRTHDSANKITAISPAGSVAYDDAGNMITAPKPGTWATAFVLKWDAWNRLVKIDNSGGSNVATFRYDGLNRRVLKVLPSSFIKAFYYSDKWQVLEERSGYGTPATTSNQFVWGTRYADDLILRDAISSSGGASSSSGTTTVRMWVMHDQWSVVAIADRNGAVIERYNYTAFGSVQYLAANYSSRSLSFYDWDVLYGDYKYDKETLLSQVRYRYLHPGLGRWLSRDPIGEVAGINLFSYVSNKPTNLADPSGLAEGTQGLWKPGKLCTDKNCDKDKCKIKMLPETPWKDKSDFENAPDPGECKEADGATRPGGVTVKIPNGWTCDIQCDENGEDTGRLNCRTEPGFGILPIKPSSSYPWIVPVEPKNDPTFPQLP